MRTSAWILRTAQNDAEQNALRSALSTLQSSHLFCSSPHRVCANADFSHNHPHMRIPLLATLALATVLQAAEPTALFDYDKTAPLDLKEVGVETRGDVGGAGLGLAFVRTVAERHGGSVEVSSELGVGSVFTLRLPMAPDELPAA